MSQTGGPANVRGPGDIAILISRTNFESSAVEIVAFSGSAQAPTIAPGSSCAEAIASLLRQQFTVGNVAIGGNPTVTEYLMVRPRGGV